MAYQAQINIKTTGLAGLNKINASVDRINKAIIQINKGGSKIKGGKEIVKINKQELEQKRNILKVETDIANQLQRQKTLRGKRGVGGATGTGGSRTGGGGSGALQSGLISGAFPLLFGQGLIGGATGFAGGFVGTKLGGQMGGFAGGLVATAALQQITTFTQEIAKLGNALSRPTENIGTLVEKLGLANDPTGRLALRLEKLGLTSSASALLMEEFTRQTGKSPDILKDAAEEINEMNKSLATFGLKLQLLGSEVITPIVDLLNKIPFGSVGKSLEPLSNLLLFGPGGNPTETINKMKGISNIPASEGNAIIGGVPLNPDFGKTPAQIGKTSAFEALANEADFNKNIRPLKQALEIEQKRLTLSTTDLNLLQEKFKLSNLQNELKILESQALIENNTKLTDQITKLKIVVDTQQQIVNNAEHLSSNFQKIGRSIASGITDNLSAAIMQTKSLGDAAKSILNDLSSTLIRLGVNTILGGLTGGSSGIFGSLPMLKFANGGRPPVGKPSIVGEKGPELFVPKRSGTIIPNDKLAGGGSTNISVNIDASGSSVQGNEQQGKELGRVISAAIQSELIKQRRPGGLLR